jgi:hypothetical protein
MSSPYDAEAVAKHVATWCDLMWDYEELHAKNASVKVHSRYALPDHFVALGIEQQKSDTAFLPRHRTKEKSRMILPVRAFNSTGRVLYRRIIYCLSFGSNVIHNRHCGKNNCSKSYNIGCPLVYLHHKLNKLKPCQTTILSHRSAPA